MHETEIQVRFCETDLLGHVNNNNFFIYMEDARIRFFNDLKLVDEDWNFILASTKCDFLKQVYYGQHLVIKSGVVKIGNASFHLEQDMYEKTTGELVAKGISVIVQFDFEEQVSQPMSAEMKKQLEAYQLAAN
ncbi:thioesterase [Halobacillus andaensis]|uniref:Thioesterase n=1 Tax=Halobacillus andaensis TaxID=1176239 RepID=A0A917B5B5_HALAA|nr:thioesterase family protein [Halobacillus andaensis]MBP2005918.1 acyl-CoA thioester hydrolase [Halobacillus andaensis]GGF25054.1 thioesterase [Halobacillus andaensis]